MSKNFRRFGMGIRIIETGEIFESMTECAEYLGVCISSISMHLSGKTKTCRGYHLETIEMRFNHALNDDILAELYDMTNEVCEWREHPYRDNVYVSDTGLVAKYQNREVVIKRLNLINSGYLVASVGDLGTIRSKNHNVLVHRLVAETFLYNDDPDHKIHVNHIDGDKTNNHVDNLEWCTRSYNMRHALDTGLYKTQRVRVVDTDTVYRSASECARAIGGTVSGMHDCKSGRQKYHRGYRIEFLEDDE